MITDREWLKIIYSYLRHQVDPQPSIPLDHLESLNIEDLHAITPDMFEMKTYTKEDVKDLLDALSTIIHKMEDDMLDDNKKTDDKVTKEKVQDPINAHKLIEFLEYEEAMTTDQKTAWRIRKLLKDLKIWS